MARFVVVTAAGTLVRNHVVSRDSAGIWSLTSVNDLREHSCSEHMKWRFRTHNRSGTGPCGTSFNRHVGRSLIREDMTPHEGQLPSLAELSTRTTRPPSGFSVTCRARNRFAHVKARTPPD
jgi:hypothetical protein